MPVNIRGKSYRTVAERVEEWRATCPITSGWALRTIVVREDDAGVMVRAEVVDPEGRIVATGHADEVRTSSQINRTSALENAETSAIGRALAACGLAGSEYASADEVRAALRSPAGASDPATPEGHASSPRGRTKRPGPDSDAPASSPRGEHAVAMQSLQRHIEDHPALTVSAVVEFFENARRAWPPEDPARVLGWLTDEGGDERIVAWMERRAEEAA